MMRSGFLPNLSLRPPTTGLDRNCRKENIEPRNPPNNTVVNCEGAPTISRNTSTYRSSDSLSGISSVVLFSPYSLVA